MSTTLNVPCGTGESEAFIPASPFTALQYHFGMLLGVEDLETAQAYPRGKMRLHNAWLHGEGAVWGLKVLFTDRRELAVDPGLAVDAAGRELHLDQRACLDVGKWYEKNKDDAAFQFADTAGGGKKFSVHVVARFKACLSRPVPSIADPCEGAQSDTAYSRVYETVELLLRPRKAQAKPDTYHRLRVLFQLEKDSAALDDVRVRREAIQGKPIAEQPAEFLQALRELAALDEIDRKPQEPTAGQPASVFPEDPTEVTLADLVDIVVQPAAAGGWAIADPLPLPDVTVRPVLISTRTIQELLCGPLLAAGAGGGAPSPAAPPDAGGPRVDPASVVIEARKITFTTTAPLAPSTVDEDAISVSSFDGAEGWSEVDIKKVDAAGTTVTVELKEEAIAGHTIRLLARGTGPFPLLGQTLVPFAGRTAGPAGTTHDGHDFVFMGKRS